MWRRWLILPAALLLYTILLCYLSTLIVALIGWSESGFHYDSLIDSIGQALSETFVSEWWWSCGPPVGILIFTQIVFVLPYVQQRPIVRTDGRPLRQTIVLAGLVAGVLTAGLLLATIEIQRVWPGGPRPLFEAHDAGWWVYPTIALCWVFWSVVLFIYTRHRAADSRLSQWLAWLFAGTIIEFVAVLPIDIMVRRKTQCYCGTGTFYALILGTWALLWLAGPGAVIGIWRRRRKRFEDTHCRRCGYAKGPQPGARCPECGYAWSATGADRNG